MDALPIPPINSLPLGLLGYLGIKNGGRNPGMLGGQLTPTLDLGFFYDGWLRKLVTTPAAEAVGAVGTTFFTGIVVPQTEIWIAEQILVFPAAALGAGVTVNFAAQLADASSNTVRLGDTCGVATTGEQPFATLDGPVLLTPGSKFGVFMRQYAGAAHNYHCYFIGSRIPA